MKCSGKLEGFRLLPTHDTRTLECALEDGHDGYCWDADGKQPWPKSGLPSARTFLVDGEVVNLPLLLNHQIGIRLHGAFCRGEFLGKDCMLRWRHLGPHAFPGKVWADKLCRLDIVPTRN